MVKRVLIVAGEASGDLHGAGVVRELKMRNKHVEVFGIGGDRMQREGMELVYHVKELSFMGFVEVLKHLPLIRSVGKTLEMLLKFKRPDVVLLIDYPGFNLRFARTAKKQGIRVVYYISPQVWAWRKSRIKKMKGIVDTMLVVFPFEQKLYHDEGIDAEFVGHPLLEVLESRLDRKNFLKRYGMEGTKRVLALLPGSRPQEVASIFPEMLSAARTIAAERDLAIAVGIAPTLEEKYFTTMFPVDGVHLIKGATYELMQHAELAIVTSGTATLETACFSTPMVVVYKTSWLTYLIGRMLVSIKNIGLVNIVAGKRIVPELIQHKASATHIAREALRILGDDKARETMRKELSAVKGVLGSVGASARVAERILQTEA
jgi:lipid-A-disaccharide synthase